MELEHGQPRAEESVRGAPPAGNVVCSVAGRDRAQRAGAV